MESIFFIDTEVSESDNKAYDYGAVNEKNGKLHTHISSIFSEFISCAKFICGHNIINHDLKYIDCCLTRKTSKNQGKIYIL